MLLLDTSSGDVFVELATDGAIVFERTETRVKQKKLGSPEAARRSLELRVRALKKLGYLDDGVVTAPKPAIGSLSPRAQQAEEGRLLFDERVPPFVAAWEAQGFDFTRSFAEEGRASKRTAHELVTMCLSLASTSFHVQFSRQQGWVDPEHGGRNRPFGVSRFDLAGFYRCPARVAAIAREKLRGRLRQDDGSAEPDPTWDWGGDEVLVRLGLNR
ncbi:MAG: hypothetical protein Q8K32_25530 [Archangium sp.]|nr:hypothetical protein [Archangium sp.]